MPDNSKLKKKKKTSCGSWLRHILVMWSIHLWSFATVSCMVQELWCGYKFWQRAENWKHESFDEILFVCVEVLWPIQPNGVMSSMVSLPNHTFNGHQQNGETNRRKYFMIKSSRKNVTDPVEVETAASWSSVGCTAKWATEAGLIGYTNHVKFHDWILYGLGVIAWTQIFITSRHLNKNEKGRVVILVCDTLSCWDISLSEVYPIWLKSYGPLQILTKGRTKGRQLQNGKNESWFLLQHIILVI